MSAGPGTPSDWVSGERVFAPPRGTVDVDWLVPAVLELAPGSTPGQARAALDAAWLHLRGDGGVAGDPSAGQAGNLDAVSAAAVQVLTEAMELFGS